MLLGHLKSQLLAMAPGANSNSSTKVFVALAILLVTATATTVHGAKEDGCIQRLDDESLPAGSSLCYERCSGSDGLMDVDSQTCFVDCVLSHGCVCPSGAAIGGDGDRGGAETTDADDAAANDDGAPPPSPLPVTLDKTLTMTVARPKISRSRQEKRRAEEALLIKVDVVGYGSVYFEVRVNGFYLDDFFALPGEDTANAIPLSSFLEEDIRADGDKTVVVSLVPNSQGKRVTVRDVRIVYQDK